MICTNMQGMKSKILNAAELNVTICRTRIRTPTLYHFRCHKQFRLPRQNVRHSLVRYCLAFNSLSLCHNDDVLEQYHLRSRGSSLRLELFCSVPKPWISMMPRHGLQRLFRYCYEAYCILVYSRLHAIFLLDAFQLVLLCYAVYNHMYFAFRTPFTIEYVSRIAIFLFLFRRIESEHSTSSEDSIGDHLHVHDIQVMRM